MASAGDTLVKHLGPELGGLLKEKMDSEHDKALAKARTFPIAEAVDSVLRKHDLSSETYNVSGGCDVRRTRGFAIKLKANEIQADGLRGLLSLSNLYVSESLRNLTDEITWEYYDKTGRRETPVILNNTYASYCVPSPKDEATSWGFLDVVDLSVVGININHGLFSKKGGRTYKPINKISFPKYRISYL